MAMPTTMSVMIVMMAMLMFTYNATNIHKPIIIIIVIINIMPNGRFCPSVNDHGSRPQSSPSKSSGN